MIKMEIAVITLELIFGLSILYILIWLGLYKLIEWLWIER